MIRLRLFLALVLAMACFPQPSLGFIFNLEPGQAKCFTEELAAVHRVELKYSMRKSHASFVAVSITGPDRTLVFKQPHAEKEYTHYFHPHIAGEYAVCFTSSEKAKATGLPLEITFTLLPEYESISQRSWTPDDDTAQKTNEHNRPLMNQARYIEQNLELLHQEYQYLKQREEMMRHDIDAMNSRTVWITVLTVGILVVVRGLHHYTLRRHLKAKRILD